MKNVDQAQSQATANIAEKPWMDPEVDLPLWPSTTLHSKILARGPNFSQQFRPNQAVHFDHIDVEARWDCYSVNIAITHHKGMGFKSNLIAFPLLSKITCTSGKTWFQVAKLSSSFINISLPLWKFKVFSTSGTRLGYCFTHMWHVMLLRFLYSPSMSFEVKPLQTNFVMIRGIALSRSKVLLSDDTVETPLGR